MGGAGETAEDECSGDSVGAFLTFCRGQRGLSENTVRAYAQDLVCFRSWRTRAGLGGPFRAEDVVAFLSHLRAEAGASPATVRRRIVTVRGYLVWCAKQSRGAVPNFAELDLDLRVPKRLPRPVDRQDLSRFLRSAPRIAPVLGRGRPRVLGAEAPDPDQVTGLAVRLLLVTGMRVGELTGLRLRDVSLSGERIRVHGKGDRERTVYVTNAGLLADFRAFLAQRMAQDDPSQAVFLNINRRPLTAAAFRKRLKRVSHDLNIQPPLTPHKFRHSAATLLIEEGVDIRLVQRLLGHASISTTELYTRVSDTSLKNAIERADTLGEVDPR